MDNRSHRQQQRTGFYGIGNDNKMLAELEDISDKMDMLIILY